MTDNVIHAFGTAPPSERQEFMIGILQEALAAVKLGGVSSLGLVLVDNGAVATKYSCYSWIEMLGAIHKAEYMIQKDIDKDID